MYRHVNTRKKDDYDDNIMDRARTVVYVLVIAAAIMWLGPSMLNIGDGASKTAAIFPRLSRSNFVPHPTARYIALMQTRPTPGPSMTTGEKPSRHGSNGT